MNVEAAWVVAESIQLQFIPTLDNYLNSDVLKLTANESTKPDGSKRSTRQRYPKVPKPWPSSWIYRVGFNQRRILDEY